METLIEVRKHAVWGAAVAVAAALAVVAWAGYSKRPASAADVTLLYVGAEDCAPCRAWRHGDGAAFFASAEFARITYREVKSPHLEDVLKEENWPEDLRRYRSSIKRSDGVPLWLVISDHEIVEEKFGASAWRESVLPRIKASLGESWFGLRANVQQ